MITLRLLLTLLAVLCFVAAACNLTIDTFGSWRWLAAGLALWAGAGLVVDRS